MDALEATFFAQLTLKLARMFVLMKSWTTLYLGKKNLVGALEATSLAQLRGKLVRIVFFS